MNSLIQSQGTIYWCKGLIYCPFSDHYISPLGKSCKQLVGIDNKWLINRIPDCSKMVQEHHDTTDLVDKGIQVNFKYLYSIEIKWNYWFISQNITVTGEEF